MSAYIWPSILAICLDTQECGELRGADGAPDIGSVIVAPSPDAVLKPQAGGSSLQGTVVTSGGDR